MNLFTLIFCGVLVMNYHNLSVFSVIVLGVLAWNCVYAHTQM